MSTKILISLSITIKSNMLKNMTPQINSLATKLSMEVPLTISDKMMILGERLSLIWITIMMLESL